MIMKDLTPQTVIRTYRRAKEKRSTWEAHWSNGDINIGDIM